MSSSNPIRAFLLGIILSCYRPLASGSVWKWAEATVVLTEGQSPGHPGPYKSRLTPYTRTVQDFDNDPHNDELFVEKSSQSGVTEAVCNIVRRRVAEKPTNILYVIDSREEAKKILKTRLAPTIRDFIPAHLKNELTADDMQTLCLYLPHMTIYGAGGYSTGATANKAIGLGVVDELDEQPPAPEGELDIVSRVLERLKTVPGKKFIGIGRPKTERGLTHVNYLTGTQEKNFVPCPHPGCGHMQELTFFEPVKGGGQYIKFDHCKDLTGEYDLQRVLKEAYFECGGCRGEIRNEHKEEMVLQGEWRITNPKHKPRRRSIHISDLYSPFATFGELAVEFLEAINGGSIAKLQAFYNSRLALPFRQQGAEITENDIMACRGAYVRGECPFSAEETVLVTVTADKQADVKKWIKAAWKKTGEMAVIDWGMTLTEDELITIANDPVIMFAGVPTEGMRAKVCLIDEGYKTTEVRDFCISSNGLFHPSKGRGGIQVKQIVHESKTDHKGVEIIVYHYDDDDFKKQTYISRIAKLADIKSGKSKVPRLWFPVHLDDDIVDECCAERFVEQKGRYGFSRWVWEKDESRANDFGDALKMHFVIWHVVGHHFQNPPPSEEPVVIGR